MKKILLVWTGGTICSYQSIVHRELNASKAKRTLIDNFYNRCVEYENMDIFEDSNFSEKFQTLSENMTITKLNRVIDHLKAFDLSLYQGIIVMHGTDTLAFSSSIFSAVFHSANIPIMLVSGNRPPLDEKSNANDNFELAVKLILSNITPNVYVPYKNLNGKTFVRKASALMQCQCFSEDFYCCDSKFSCEYENEGQVCKWAEKFKTIKEYFNYKDLVLKEDAVLLVNPYLGVNYENISLNGIKAVVHSTYHSNTVCVERNNEKDEFSSHSILWFSNQCERGNIQLFVCPSKRSVEQYTSASDLQKNGKYTEVYSTVESCYAKVLIGVSLGYSGEKLTKFVSENINYEIMD